MLRKEAIVMDEEVSYKIELQFNDVAELVHVQGPDGFTPAMISNHIAVAGLFLAQKLVDMEQGKGVRGD